MILYVKEKYKIEYTISGFTNWLSRNGFLYKQPKGVPLKADSVKQDMQYFDGKFEEFVSNHYGN